MKVKVKVKICGLYEIINSFTGIRYVGSSSNILHRFHTHRSALKLGKHENAYLQNAWNKYGEEAFVFEIICETTEDNKRVSEQRLLDGAMVSGEKLYNISPIADGGMTGRRHTEESKRKMSEKAKGRKLSEERCRQIAETSRGRKHSEETKAKISAGNKGVLRSVETLRRMSEAQMGKKRSKQAILKWKVTMAGREPTRSNLGKKASLETRLKMSASHRGRPHTPEHVAKVTASACRTRAIKRFLASEQSSITCLI